MRSGTPYRVIGGVRFYQRREVKDVLAYLRLLVNPQDVISARRVINTPKRGIGDATRRGARGLRRPRGGRHPGGRPSSRRDPHPRRAGQGARSMGSSR